MDPRCVQSREQFLDYLDGTLDTGALMALQAHLNGCASCRQELALVQRVEAALESAVQTVPPAGNMLGDFHERLAASQVRHPLLQWRVAVPAFALGLLAVALIVPKYLSGIKGTQATAPSMGTERAPRLAETDVIALSPLSHRSNGEMLAPSVTAIAPNVIKRPPVRIAFAETSRSSGRSVWRAPMGGTGAHSPGDRLAPDNSYEPPKSTPVADNEPARDAFADQAPEGMASSKATAAPSITGATNGFAAHTPIMRYPLPASPGGTPPESSPDVVNAPVRSLKAAKKPAASDDSQGFSMVVQDDVRGFTFETHCANTEVDAAGDRVIRIDIRDDGPSSLH